VLRAFPPEAASARAAQRLADAVTVSRETRAIIRSLIGELADNASRHAGTPFMVTLSAEATVISIAVQDQSSALPVMRSLHAAPERGGGRGLHIVDRLAHQWGATPLRPAGKTVWARLYPETSGLRPAS
jgi:anti-sigma regulatory factor (Ser/Thr protein kinase)